MKAWQYSSNTGGIDKEPETEPLPQTKPSQHLVKVIAACLNPVDYKPAETPIFGRLAVSKPATPGLDFVRTIVKPASGSSLTPGTKVFGVTGTSPFAGGALREYAVAESRNVVIAPEGLNTIDAATIGVAALTAYQSTIPYIKNGDKVFLNGGSGGCGAYCVQYARLICCYVVTTCSTANVELCKQLGADDIVDYKKGNVADALVAKGYKFDHAVDNVGLDGQLIWASHKFMAPGSTYVVVGGGFENIRDTVVRKVLPRFLGGLQNTVVGFWPKPEGKDLLQVADWSKAGKVKALIDERFPLEQAPNAIEKLKMGRAKGKIMVNIAAEAS